METYAAFLIGIGGGVSYMITTWLVLFKLKVDDPLDACAGICITWSFATSNIPDIKIPTILINLTQCIGILCMYLCILYTKHAFVVIVHYGGGVWGVISVGLLSRDVGILYKRNVEAALVIL